jgi:hypothetical protein
MSAAMIRRLGPVVLVALQGWACGEPRLLAGFSEGLTRLRLAPTEFVGSVPCRKDTPGALRAYVAQIHEVTPGGADGGSATVFTSGAVPCDQAVMVPAVPTRWYAAAVFGYDDTVSDAELSPNNARWTATCGRGTAFNGDAGLDPYRPTLAQRGLTVPMRSCTSFFGGGDGASQLVVDQLGALGALSCGLGAGEVSAFRGTLDGISRTAACGEPLVFDVAGVERYHTIELVAFEASADAGPTDAAPPPPDGPPVVPPDASLDAGDALDGGLPVLPPVPVPSGDAGSSDAGPPLLVLGEPRWRTQCVGRSLPGVASPAFCDPLVALP